jgi:hypothetical protein
MVIENSTVEVDLLKAAARVCKRRRREREWVRREREKQPQDETPLSMDEETGAKNTSKSYRNVPGDEGRRTTSTTATTDRSKIPNLTLGETHGSPSLSLHGQARGASMASEPPTL